MKNKIAGCLIGSAIGDGFGYPTEFKSLQEIKEQWGPQGLQEPIGEIIKVTDDTQMTLAVSRALMQSYQADQIDPQLLEKNLIQEFIRWLNDPENNRAPGMTCLSSCERLEKGMDWQEATSKNSKGCGANMRVIPVGLFKFKNESISDEDIAKWSQLQSALTHAHPTALTASELTAITVVKIIEGVTSEKLVEVLMNYCNKQKDIYHSDYLKQVWERPGFESEKTFINRGWNECLEVLAKVKAALLIDEKEIIDPCDYTGEGWIAEEAFGTALLCFLLNPNDSKKVLIRAVNTRGDSDSIACLAGGFVGAQNGIDSFPEDWVNRVEYQEELNQFLEFIDS